MSILVIVGLIAAGVATGIVSALFGVGGGILIVPLLVLGLDEGQHLAQGTSLLVIIPTALIGVLVHKRKDYVSFRYAGFLAAGGIGGAFLGSLVALGLKGDSLRILFGILMALVALRTLRRGWVHTQEERAAAEPVQVMTAEYLPPAD